MNKSYVRTFDPNLEKLCPTTTRENYLHGNCLQFMDVIEECHDQIFIRDKIIDDFKLKLQEEKENSENWRNKMLEERGSKNMARREFEWKCEREIDLLKVCSTHRNEIKQLKSDILKVTQQNKELNRQLEDLANGDCNKQNYQLKTEVLEKDIKLQICCDSMATQRDKAEENFATISHNLQLMKKNYE